MELPPNPALFSLSPRRSAPGAAFPSAHKRVGNLVRNLFGPLARLAPLHWRGANGELGGSEQPGYATAPGRHRLRLLGMPRLPGRHNVGRPRPTCVAERSEIDTHVAAASETTARPTGHVSPPPTLPAKAPIHTGSRRRPKPQPPVASSLRERTDIRHSMTVATPPNSPRCGKPKFSVVAFSVEL